MCDHECKPIANDHEEQGKEVIEDVLDDVVVHHSEVASGQLQGQPTEDEDEFEPGNADAHSADIAGHAEPNIKVTK